MYQRVDCNRTRVDISFLFDGHLIIPSVQKPLDSMVNDVLGFKTIVKDLCGKNKDNNLNNASVQFVRLFRQPV